MPNYTSTWDHQAAVKKLKKKDMENTQTQRRKAKNNESRKCPALNFAQEVLCLQGLCKNRDKWVH